MLKKKYIKPSFQPIVLDANVLADGCKYTNSWGWQSCPIEIDLGYTVVAIFSDSSVCNYGNTVGICDLAPTPNSNVFGS